SIKTAARGAREKRRGIGVILKYTGGGASNNTTDRRIGGVLATEDLRLSLHVHPFDPILWIHQKIKVGADYRLEVTQVLRSSALMTERQRLRYRSRRRGRTFDAKDQRRRSGA